MMKTYEFAYLISPDLGEEELKAFQEKITVLVQNAGAILTEINQASRKKLAYPIKKKLEAYFATLVFELDQSKIRELEKKLKEESQILRFLLLFKPPRKISARYLRRFTSKPETEIAAKEAKTAEPKVEIGEIDKKLEEILGE